jgi:hypothetical protein
MLTLAYSLFWVNFLYGIAVKFKLLHNKKFKFLHHAIYFLVMLTLFISIGFEFYYQKFLSVSILIFLFVVLLLMTQFSGKSPNHWKYAILCNLIYTTAFIYLSYGSF